MTTTTATSIILNRNLMTATPASRSTNRVLITSSVATKTTVSKTRRSLWLSWLREATTPTKPTPLLPHLLARRRPILFHLQPPKAKSHPLHQSGRLRLTQLRLPLVIRLHLQVLLRLPTWAFLGALEHSLPHHLFKYSNWIVSNSN